MIVAIMVSMVITVVVVFVVVVVVVAVLVIDLVMVVVEYFLNPLRMKLELLILFYMQMEVEANI